MDKEYPDRVNGWIDILSNVQKTCLDDEHDRICPETGEGTQLLDNSDGLLGHRCRPLWLRKGTVDVGWNDRCLERVGCWFAINCR